jgi:hypothetical protein
VIEERFEEQDDESYGGSTPANILEGKGIVGEFEHKEEETFSQRSPAISAATPGEPPVC